jgi:cell division septal protein FtsQ
MGAAGCAFARALGARRPKQRERETMDNRNRNSRRFEAAVMALVILASIATILYLYFFGFS